jgi:hypothetical protein
LQVNDLQGFTYVNGFVNEGRLYRLGPPGDRSMSLPRDPGRDLRLQRLDDRDGLRPAHLGESALVGQALAQQGIQDLRAAYEALIDAVFTAPGATEWLSALRRAVAAMLASKHEGVRLPVQYDAIRQAEPGPGRG